MALALTIPFCVESMANVSLIEICQVNERNPKGRLNGST